MDTNDDIQRTLGVLQGQFGAHTERADRLEITVNGVNDKVDLILQELAVQKGERRARHGIAASSAAIFGTVAALLVEWFTSRHG